VNYGLLKSELNFESDLEHILKTRWS